MLQTRKVIDFYFIIDGDVIAIVDCDGRLLLLLVPDFYLCFYCFDKVKADGDYKDNIFLLLLLSFRLVVFI